MADSHPLKARPDLTWGGRLLAAHTAARPARRALETLDGLTIRQGGTVGLQTSAEISITFDVSLIDGVAAILAPKRPPKRLGFRAVGRNADHGREFAVAVVLLGMARPGRGIRPSRGRLV